MGPKVVTMLGCLQGVRQIMNSVRNRKTFFEVVSRLFPPSDWRYKIIREAYEDAKAAFRNVKREDGERYFEHPRIVALFVMVYLRVKNYELIVAALLHDIVEDIDHWTVERVRQKYGERIAELVERLSKRPLAEFSSKEERLAVYHGLFRSADRDFFLIKLSDRLHNLLTQGVCSREKIRRKIDETKLYYLPYAEENLILFHEISGAIQELEEKFFPANEPPESDSRFETL